MTDERSPRLTRPPTRPSRRRAERSTPATSPTPSADESELETAAEPARPSDVDAEHRRPTASPPSRRRPATRATRQPSRRLPARRTVGRLDRRRAARRRRPLRLHRARRVVPRPARRARRRRHPGRRDAPRGRRRVHGRGPRPADRSPGGVPRDPGGRRRQPRDRHPHRPPGLDADVRARRPGRARAPRPRGLPGDRPGRHDRRPRQVGGRADRRPPTSRRPGRGRSARPLAGRPGPVLLSLPEDLLDEPSPDDAEVAADATVAARPARRRRSGAVIELLASAERPVILAGGGVLRARTSTELLRFAELLQVPVIASWRRARRHLERPPAVSRHGRPRRRPRPSASGSPRPMRCSSSARRLNEADHVRLHDPGGRRRAGRTSTSSRGAAAGPAAGRPRRRRRRPGVPAGRERAPARRARCSTPSASATRRREQRGRPRRLGGGGDRRRRRGRGTAPASIPAASSRPCARVLPDDAIVDDRCRATSPAGPAAASGSGGPGTFLGPTSGAMGYGLPAAIAAALVHRDRPVVALVGDGGLAMTMAELETAVREGARVIVLVFDNERYGTIRMWQDAARARRGRRDRARAGRLRGDRPRPRGPRRAGRARRRVRARAPSGARRGSPDGHPARPRSGLGVGRPARHRLDVAGGRVGRAASAASDRRPDVATPHDARRRRPPRAARLPWPAPPRRRPRSGHGGRYPTLVGLQGGQDRRPREDLQAPDIRASMRSSSARQGSALDRRPAATGPRTRARPHGPQRGRVRSRSAPRGGPGPGRAAPAADRADPKTTSVAVS